MHIFIEEAITIEKLISVIIPVYNKESYLDKCVQSLIDLDMNKDILEAIFIDDVSTDQSFKMLKDYESQYEFIKVLQLGENSGGPAEPRNLGMDAAQGEYIALLDADDWLDAKGFPKLVNQMKTHDSDIGFGQTYKHKDEGVNRLSRFASYKEDNGLVPYEIYKIFRAVGPPGKVFKKSTVDDNHIKFRHMKYGEDKLFFAELISKSQSASMSPEPMYHVNRFSENESLVKETNKLEKADLNLEVLKQCVQLSIPNYAKEQLLSRILEMDYMSRFFVTRSFINSNKKDDYINKFKQVLSIIENEGYDIDDLLITPKFKIVYTLFKRNIDDMIEYIYHLIYRSSQSKYIENQTVYYQFPEKFNDLDTLKDDFYPVYNGTRVVNGVSYDLIEIFNPYEYEIEFVELIKIKNDLVSKRVDYSLKDSMIYIKSSELDLNGDSFNIGIQYGKFNYQLVYATYPNLNSNAQLNRQNFKVEFKVPNASKSTSNSTYLTETPKQVVVKSKIKSYNNADFNEQIQTFKIGTLIHIQSISQTSKGTPRLVTTDGEYITANKDYVSPIDISKLNEYITNTPKTVRIIKNCKLYPDIPFKKEPIQPLTKGTELNIIDIVYTKSLTPRLVTEDGYYLTSNIKFVQALN